MIYQSRSFEHRGQALRRDHLLPVKPSTWSKVHRAAFRGPEPWWKAMLGWLAIFGVAAVALGIFN